MTYNEMRRLSRADLLDLTASLADENKDLLRQIDFLRKKLDDRFLAVLESGSIADAALKVSGVFQAAQEAADLYLENVRITHPPTPPPQSEKVQTDAVALPKADLTPETSPDWESVRSSLEEYCRTRWK